MPGGLRDNERVIRLGTDRLIRLGHSEPEVVLEFFKDGTGVTISGAIDVGLAIEVKGRSNAQGGLTQLRSLHARSKQGYTIVGNQLWLLQYDPSKVVHLLVAPPGPEPRAAKKEAATLRRRGFNVKVVAIPLARDDDIKKLAKQYLQSAARR